MHSYTYVLVAANETTLSAKRITSLASFTSTLTAASMGIAVRYIRYLKPIILFGFCVEILAFGLMIRYRGSGATTGDLAAVQVVRGLGVGAISFPVQAAIQSVTKRECTLSFFAREQLDNRSLTCSFSFRYRSDHCVCCPAITLNSRKIADVFVSTAPLRNSGCESESGHLFFLYMALTLCVISYRPHALLPQPGCRFSHWWRHLEQPGSGQDARVHFRPGDRRQGVLEPDFAHLEVRAGH